MQSILQAHAFSRGVWGHVPRKILKLDALRLNLRLFSLKEVTVCETSTWLYIYNTKINVASYLVI